MADFAKAGRAIADLREALDGMELPSEPGRPSRTLLDLADHSLVTIAAHVELLRVAAVQAAVMRPVVATANPDGSDLMVRLAREA